MPSRCCSSTYDFGRHRSTHWVISHEVICAALVIGRIGVGMLTKVSHSGRTGPEYGRPDVTNWDTKLRPAMPHSG